MSNNEGQNAHVGRDNNQVIERNKESKKRKKERYSRS